MNQWQYQSVKGRLFNCEFWYNSGSLTGNALPDQSNRVVISCEAVGSIVILGFVTDAGGNNARLMELLGGHILLQEGSWTSDKSEMPTFSKEQTTLNREKQQRIISGRQKRKVTK